MMSNKGTNASSTMARCLRTDNGNNAIMTRATVPLRNTAKMLVHHHQWQRCLRINGDDTSSTMSNEGNEETAGRTTMRITSGSTWAWNMCRRGIYSWNKYEDPPATCRKDWYSLSNNERHATSQLCYSRRTWDSYKAVLGEHPLERPNFRFMDCYTVNVWYGLVVKPISSKGERPS